MSDPIEQQTKDHDEEEVNLDKKQKNEPGRALYIGNLNSAATSYFDLCGLANEYGALEMVKVVPHKGCAFLNFVEESAAQIFYDAAQEKEIVRGDNALKIRWAKANPIKEELMEKIKAGATRNLFIGNLSDVIDEEGLAHCFSRFGPFENIVILRPKGIAFVNLTSIRSAIAAKSTLDGTELGGRKIKVNFAKEKIGPKRRDSARRPSTGGGRPQFIAPPPPPSWGGPPPPPPPPPPTEGLPYYPPPPPPPPQFYPGPTPLEYDSGSRAVYLGNVHDDVTFHDLCKIANRYGGIESVKIVKSKQCAFLNFLDSGAAHAFYNASRQTPITINSQTIRVNWAKSAPLPPDIAAQVRAGATRNLFIGNVEDHITEDQIRDLFSAFGEFDNISILRAKKIAFVNLTSVKSALRAREALQGQAIGDPPVPLKINFAKEGASRGKARKSFSRPAPSSPIHSQEPAVATSLFSQFPPAPDGVEVGYVPEKKFQAERSEVAGPGSRAIYIGQLPMDCSPRDLAQYANQFGAIEQLSVMLEKKCAFINFVDPQAAAGVINLSAESPVVLRGKQVRVGWAKSSAIDPVLMDHIRNGATRNLFVGSVAPGVTQEHLAQVFAPFGPFENIVILRSKGIAFVNLCSIKAAINARAGINRDPGTVVQGMRLKVNFAKEKVGINQQQSPERTEEY